MRIVNLGIDDQGRSCVVQEREVETAEAVPGVAMMSLFHTEVSDLSWDGGRCFTGRTPAGCSAPDARAQQYPTTVDRSAVVLCAM